LLWNLSAALRGYLRFYMPTNRAADWLKSPRGLKWAVPVALIATPSYLPAMSVCATLVERGARGPQFAGVGLHLERNEVSRRRCLDSRPMFDWSVLGTVPEMLQTSYGSLTVGLDIQPGQTLFIGAPRRASAWPPRCWPSVRDPGHRHHPQPGQCRPAARARRRSRPRRRRSADGRRTPDRAWRRGHRSTSWDHPTLMDCLHATRVRGVVCMSGMLSNHLTLPDFYPTGDIPSGVRLTGYTGDATDLPAVLQRFLDDVAAGNATVPIGKALVLEEIQRGTGSWRPARPAGRSSWSWPRGARRDRPAGHPCLVDRAGASVPRTPPGHSNATSHRLRRDVGADHAEGSMTDHPPPFDGARHDSTVVPREAPPAWGCGDVQTVSTTLTSKLGMRVGL
jgi:hypothetical protein